MEEVVFMVGPNGTLGYLCEPCQAACIRTSVYESGIIIKICENFGFFFIKKKGEDTL